MEVPARPKGGVPPIHLEVLVMAMLIAVSWIAAGYLGSTMILRASDLHDGSRRRLSEADDAALRLVSLTGPLAILGAVSQAGWRPRMGLRFW